MRAAVRSGDLYNPLLGNTLASYVKMGTGFTLRVDGTFNQAVPVGASGSSLDLWTIPDTTDPILITNAYLVVTGDASATVNPTTPNVCLRLGSYSLMEAGMTSWGGTSYSVAAGSTNKKFFGGLAADRNEGAAPALLNDTTTLTDNGAAIRGGEASSTGLLIDGGGTNKLAASVLKLNMNHGLGVSTTITMPFRVYLFGFFG